ncbi:MAG: class I SAM-dependent methyltransferase [Prochlorococcaceae cyanobacterium]|jgi:SAM-dependent methyltransferase
MASGPPQSPPGPAGQSSPAGPADWFGAVAADYVRFRLTYPEAFFERFAARAPDRDRVWDCGCGSGQASLALARHFRHVLATDASAAQLAAAAPQERVEYRLASATASGLPSGSVSAVLVAAAVHWFAGPAFDAEVCRVARPGAALAWIGYLPVRMPTPELRQWFDGFYGVTLEPWWPPQRQLVDSAYASLAFPGQEWPFPPDLQIERRWDLPTFLGHLGTWSALQRAREQGVDPLPAAAAQLERLWPEGGRGRLLLVWPFMGRWGRLSPAGP